MDGNKLKKVIGYVNNAGIKRFTIYCNNSYLIEVDSDSTKVIFDDTNQMLWYFRIPNMVQPKDFRPLAIECLEYDIIERVCIQTTTENVKAIAKSAGLNLTEDITKWLKTAGSQSALNPIQNKFAFRSNTEANEDTEQERNPNESFIPNIMT